MMRWASTATPSVSPLTTHDSNTAPKRRNVVVRGRQQLLRYGRRHGEHLTPHPFQPSRRVKGKSERESSCSVSERHGFVPAFFSLGCDRSRSPRSVPAFLPRKISVGPRFSSKVREEPQRRERKWGRKLCSQGFCDSQTQDERAYSGGCDESRTPQSTYLPAEPKRKSKNKRTTAVRATKAKRAADENDPPSSLVISSGKGAD